MTGPRRLILVGGGHAHVEVLRGLAAAPLPGVETIVVSDRTHSLYSGMVPGYVAGQYQRAEIELDVEALARRAQARWVHARATGVDPSQRQVVLEGAAPLEYTVASLDIGATVAGTDLPGVRAHALPARPISQLVEQLTPSATGAIAVVGGGAAGVELACCLQQRAQPPGGPARETNLIESGPQILADASRSLRRAAEAALRERSITVHCNSRVRRVDSNGVELTQGRHIEATQILWVTGASPHPALRGSALPCDDAGFVRVDPTLEVSGCPGLFAVGDCASLPGAPKAGVHAVRQGPVLEANLRASLFGEALRSYSPQGDFLRILNLGDGSAIASKWGLTRRGRVPMRLKDHVDRSWLDRYRA